MNNSILFRILIEQFTLFVIVIDQFSIVTLIHIRII